LPISSKPATKDCVIANAARLAGVSVLTHRPSPDFDLVACEQLVPDLLRVDMSILRAVAVGTGLCLLSALELDEAALRNFEMLETLRDEAAG
jgi:hypothetical protein